MNKRLSWYNLSIPHTIGIGAGILLAIYTLRVLTKSRRKRKITKIIETIEEFDRPSVHMKNPQEVEDKVCQLIKGGASKLQVISDFDMTLSRFHCNGKRCLSCHGVLETSPRMPKDYREKVTAYKERYYPIEIDPTLSPAQKTPFMIEWWNSSHKVLLESGVNKSELRDMVRESNVMLRDGCSSMLDLLHDHNVPVLIFSAGIGDILEEVLHHQANFHDNIKVIANYMNFAADGKLLGFKSDLIHSFNKNSSAIHKSDYFSNIKERTNVILLGDSLGDLGMSSGLPHIETILRIGFLNDRIDQSLPKYLESFDIVLANDQSLDIVNSLLNKIL